MKLLPLIQAGWPSTKLGRYKPSHLDKLIHDLTEEGFAYFRDGWRKVKQDDIIEAKQQIKLAKDELGNNPNDESLAVLEKLQSRLEFLNLQFERVKQNTRHPEDAKFLANNAKDYAKKQFDNIAHLFEQVSWLTAELRRTKKNEIARTTERNAAREGHRARLEEVKQLKMRIKNLEKQLNDLGIAK